LPAGAWQEVEVRDSEKGPLAVQAVRAPVQARADNRASEVAEVLVVFRERQPDGSWKHDYLLSNAPADTSAAEFARVFNAHHRVEECLKRAKGEAGLGDYQVRTWGEWHHHQALSLIATWFLSQEARRGKKADPGADRPPGPACHRPGAAPGRGVRPTRLRRTMERWLRRNEEARFYHWKRRNRLPPRRLGREAEGTQ
jgi:hypothetical protein